MDDQEYQVRIAVLEEKVGAQRREIDQQAKEYERRLSELNHAHAQQVADKQYFISDDKFQGFLNEYVGFKADVQKALFALQANDASVSGRSSGWSGAQQLFFQVLPMIISVVAVIVLLLKK